MEKTPPDTFGESLRQLRLQAGLTQQQLGEALEGSSVTGAAISDLEREKSNPGPELAHALATALQVPPEEVPAFLLAAAGHELKKVEAVMANYRQATNLPLTLHRQENHLQLSLTVPEGQNPMQVLYQHLAQLLTDSDQLDP